MGPFLPSAVYHHRLAMSSTSPRQPRRAPSVHSREPNGGVTKAISSLVHRRIWCQAAHLSNPRPSTLHILRMAAHQPAPTFSGRPPHPRLAPPSLLEVCPSMA